MQGEDRCSGAPQKESSQIYYHQFGCLAQTDGSSNNPDTAVVASALAPVFISTAKRAKAGKKRKKLKTSRFAPRHLRADAFYIWNGWNFLNCPDLARPGDAHAVGHGWWSISVGMRDCTNASEYARIGFSRTAPGRCVPFGPRRDQEPVREQADLLWATSIALATIANLGQFPRRTGRCRTLPQTQKRWRRRRIPPHRRIRCGRNRINRRSFDRLSA